MNANSKVTKDNVDELLRAMVALASREVLVGVPEAETDRDPNAAAVDITNATLAAIHENGSTLANIPARPFLAPGISSAQNRIAGYYERAARAALDGKEREAENALNAAGLAAQNSIRAKITSGPFTPLAASTIAARKRRGRTGTKPLLDTGQLRNSITYVIREK